MGFNTEHLNIGLAMAGFLGPGRNALGAYFYSEVHYDRSWHTELQDSPL